MKEVKGKDLAGWGEEGSSLPVGGARGLMRGRSVHSQPYESSIQPWSNKNTIIERSPPPTTTYYTNNTLSFCLLMIYFLNISHALDLISLLLKCKLGSLPLQQIVSHKWTFALRGGAADRQSFFLHRSFQNSCSKPNQDWPAWRASSGASAGLPLGFALDSSAALCLRNSSPARARAASSPPSFSAVAAKTKEDCGTLMQQTESNNVQQWNKDTIDCWDLCWLVCLAAI